MCLSAFHHLADHVQAAFSLARRRGDSDPASEAKPPAWSRSPVARGAGDSVDPGDDDGISVRWCCGFEDLPAVRWILSFREICIFTGVQYGRSYYSVHN